jgi:hypothetical protein
MHVRHAMQGADVNKRKPANRASLLLPHRNQLGLGFIYIEGIRRRGVGCDTPRKARQGQRLACQSARTPGLTSDRSSRQTMSRPWAPIAARPRSPDPVRPGSPGVPRGDEIDLPRSHVLRRNEGWQEWGVTHRGTLWIHSGTVRRTLSAHNPRAVTICHYVYTRHYATVHTFPRCLRTRTHGHI